MEYGAACQDFAQGHQRAIPLGGQKRALYVDARARRQAGGKEITHGRERRNSYAYFIYARARVNIEQPVAFGRPCSSNQTRRLTVKTFRTCRKRQKVGRIRFWPPVETHLENIVIQPGHRTLSFLRPEKIFFCRSREKYISFWSSPK